MLSVPVRSSFVLQDTEVLEAYLHVAKLVFAGEKKGLVLQLKGSRNPGTGVLGFGLRVSAAVSIELFENSFWQAILLNCPGNAS